MHYAVSLTGVPLEPDIIAAHLDPAAAIEQAGLGENLPLCIQFQERGLPVLLCRADQALSPDLGALKAGNHHRRSHEIPSSVNGDDGTAGQIDVIRVAHHPIERLEEGARGREPWF